ncbi:MAG: molybdopterin molybdotransferase MoeA [Synergistaceae bacterium]|nr:molybdopterin molybdotransferase MoeA [Synergistaceae bacterium]
MAGFVKEVTPRLQALEYVSGSLCFPWDTNLRVIPLENSIGRRLSNAQLSDMPYPPYTRSLRDGYAVRSSDVSAATYGTPTFLNKIGEVTMGIIPDVLISSGEAAAIPTGGVLPEGTDSVVMLEDTCLTGGWVEVRKGVQSGENIIKAGEEIKVGEQILGRGDIVDFRSVSLLATLGINKVSTVDLRINLLSTGDEIVPVEVSPLPPGCIRDANGLSLCAMLQRYGFASEYRGIVSDDGVLFEKRVADELADCDVLVLSGGSSVGVRDHCSRVLESLPSPGLLVRGVNIVPGKPTLIAGCYDKKKLVVSLPGHPLSCLTAAYVILIPLLLLLIGAENETHGNRLFLELAKDLTARSGPEEFTPCCIKADGRVSPLLAKSGYVSGLTSADGLIRIPEDRETMRAGDIVEVWTW